MGIFSDNSGIAYALTYIMVTLMVVCVGWIILGIVVDEFSLLSTDLVSAGICGDKTVNAIADLETSWKLVLWLTAGCGFLYGIISAIRKERGGVING